MEDYGKTTARATAKQHLVCHSRSNPIAGEIGPGEIDLGMRFLVLCLLLTPLILGGCVYIHTTTPPQVYYYESVLATAATAGRQAAHPVAAPLIRLSGSDPWPMICLAWTASRSNAHPSEFTPNSATVAAVLFDQRSHGVPLPYLVPLHLFGMSATWQPTAAILRPFRLCRCRRL